MKSTRVGYAGGHSPTPTYHNLGGHSESLRITYDPALISYRELLRIFFEAHRPTSPAWSQQYASIIFVQSEEERRIAEEALAEARAHSGQRLYTTIRPLERFHSAENYHQKYYLRRHEKLFPLLRAHFAGEDAFIDSTAALRANAFVSGHLDDETLAQELEAAGLPEGIRHAFGKEEKAPFCSF